MCGLSVEQLFYFVNVSLINLKCVFKETILTNRANLSGLNNVHKL